MKLEKMKNAAKSHIFNIVNDQIEREMKERSRVAEDIWFTVQETVNEDGDAADVME